jgi:hypothetical protein
MLQYYNWTKNSTDAKVILTNFGLNLGKDLNNIKDFVLYFADTVYQSNAYSPSDAGNLIGNIIRSFFISLPLKKD